jgi:hypothetical protein
LSDIYCATIKNSQSPVIVVVVAAVADDEAQVKLWLMSKYNVDKIQRLSDNRYCAKPCGWVNGQVLRANGGFA